MGDGAMEARQLLNWWLSRCKDAVFGAIVDSCSNQLYRSQFCVSVCWYYYLFDLLLSTEAGKRDVR